MNWASTCFRNPFNVCGGPSSTITCLSSAEGGCWVITMWPDPPPASSLSLNLNLHLTPAHMWHTCSFLCSISQCCLASQCTASTTSSCSYNTRYQHRTTSEPPPPLLHLHTMKTSPPRSAAVRPEPSLSLQGHTHTRPLTRLHMQNTSMLHLLLLLLLLLLLVHMRVFVAHQVSKTATQLIVCLTPVRSCPLKSQRICKPFDLSFCCFVSYLRCGESSPAVGRRGREKKKHDAERRMLQTRAERSSDPGPYREKQAETLCCCCPSWRMLSSHTTWPQRTTCRLKHWWTQTASSGDTMGLTEGGDVSVAISVHTLRLLLIVIIISSSSSGCSITVM